MSLRFARVPAACHGNGAGVQSLPTRASYRYSAVYKESWPWPNNSDENNLGTQKRVPVIGKACGSNAGPSGGSGSCHR